jgi:hypothetical protein
MAEHVWFAVPFLSISCAAELQTWAADFGESSKEEECDNDKGPKECQEGFLASGSLQNSFCSWKRSGNIRRACVCVDNTNTYLPLCQSHICHQSAWCKAFRTMYAQVSVDLFKLVVRRNLGFVFSCLDFLSFLANTRGGNSSRYQPEWCELLCRLQVEIDLLTNVFPYIVSLYPVARHG